MTTLMPLEQLAHQRFETPVILKKLAFPRRLLFPSNISPNQSCGGVARR